MFATAKEETARDLIAHLEQGTKSTVGISPDFSRQVCRERSALFFSYPPASSIVVAEIRIGETGSLLPR